MDGALVLCRFVNLATSLGVFGSLVFQIVLAPAALAAHVRRRLRPAMLTGATIVAVTSLLWLMALAATMGDDWSAAFSGETLGIVLFGTEFGHVWQWHVVLSVLLVATLALDGRLPKSAGLSVALVLSALQLMTLGFVGHAVMASGWSGLINRASLAVHLLGGGYWLGCLVPVMLCLRLEGPDLHRDAKVALRRFSSVGHVAVALVIVTGVINTDIIVGSLWPRFANAYQDLLAVKIAVVAIMVLLAILNRYALVPQLRRSPLVIDTIQRVFAVVYALGLGAVALVSLFGTLAPT